MHGPSFMRWLHRCTFGPTGSYSHKVVFIPTGPPLLPLTLQCAPGHPRCSSVLCLHGSLGHCKHMKPGQDPARGPSIHHGEVPFCTGMWGPTHPEMVGQASAVPSVGMQVGLVVAVVMQVVVLQAPVVHVASVMGLVEVSQVAPTREEPRLDPPDSVSPHRRTVPLHVIVPLPSMQAGGQQQQQQQNGHSTACDQAHESRAPQEALHLGSVASTPRLLLLPPLQRPLLSPQSLDFVVSAPAGWKAARECGPSLFGLELLAKGEARRLLTVGRPKGKLMGTED